MKPALEPIPPLRLQRSASGAIIGVKPPPDVATALADARAMGIRSVWCRGLWVFDPLAWAWRAVAT